MARDALTGSRIRERRVMAGIKQADLARDVAISASYLNLIEHNRRRIGGKLLLDIAEALGVEPQLLSEGAEAALIATLREAADEAGLTGAEALRADEFAGRFPGWADALARTRQKVLALEETVEALTDRMRHDPHLAASMHELLSTVAAVRSTASILAETETLQPEWQSRFHANINEDSRRLSDSAQALVNYLDGEGADLGSAGSPQEEVETFLAAHDFSFASLEDTSHPEAEIMDLIEGAATLKTVAARHIAQGVLSALAQDARSLKLDDLRGSLQGAAPDPLAIACHFGQPVALVLRRLAALPELGAGLVVCDRSGTVTYRKSVEGFIVPRHGACCPLWPLFSVLGQPGQVLREKVTQQGRVRAPFDCFAASEAAMPPRYGAAPLVQGVMLILPAAEGEGQGTPMGATCRICPVEDCVARREPSILSTGV